MSIKYHDGSGWRDTYPRPPLRRPVAGGNTGQNVDLTGYAKETWVQEGFQPKGDYLTEVPEGYAKTEDIPTKPEDIGALPSTYTPPNQTAAQVGADPKGTAAAAVSGHNVSTDAHGDIRLLIEGLATRLNALANSTDKDLDQMAELVAYIKSNKSLIDGITTSKVSISDIVDNLTTNVANKPLSAAQGVVIKGLIDALQTGKLDVSKLQDAINTALAQAKESGEFKGADGRGIKSIVRTSGTGSPGTTDIYTITYTDGTSSSYTVYNGKDGSAAAVPQAVIDGASALVDKALSRGAANVLRFLAFSDAHQKPDNAYIIAGNKELGMAVGEVVDRVNVDFVSNLGDSAWASYTNTTEDTLEQLKAFNALIKPYTQGELVLNCEGNHDDSVYSTIDNDGDGATASATKLTVAAVYALVHPSYRDVVWDPAHGSDGYYYRDFPRLKTRAIFLNTEQGAGDGGVMEGYQLKWLAETALDMSGKDDWNVVTLAHHPLDWGNGSLFKDAVNIMDAFIGGAALSYTTQDGTKISVDYSTKSCQYVGHFHGHTHAFCITRMQKYVSGSYVDINAWQIGIPNACYSRNNHNLGNANERIARFSTPTTYNKSDTDGQRTSLNLVSVDLDSKIIYADNYGAGIDRQISYSFAAVMHSVTNALTGCSSSNAATSVEDGASYSATITANDGYTMDDAAVSVTMGGVDITETAYSGGVVTIAAVTGDVSITVSAVAIPTISYTNQLPISTDADGNIYNGKGYKENYKLGSTAGEEQSATGINMTGFIPIGVGSSSTALGEQVVRIANAKVTAVDNSRVGLFDGNKSPITVIKGTKFGNGVVVPGVNIPYEVDDSGYITYIDLTQITYNRKNVANAGATAFIRLSGAGIDGDTIITVNEEIV